VVIKDILNSGESRMRGAIQVLQDDLAAVRTGRASPGLVERLQVEYARPQPDAAGLDQRPEPRSLMIKFDASTLKVTRKRSRPRSWGLSQRWQVIHLNLPPIFEDRRRDLVKHVHHRLEESRIAIRNIRRDIHNDMRDFEKEKLVSEDELKRGEDDLQKLTDRFIEEIAELGKKKEAEIMEV
jgi:ribosome recycling factor